MLVFGVALTVLCQLVAAEKKVATFYGSRLSPRLVDGFVSATTGSDWTAQATYTPSSDHVSNFAQLNIESNKEHDDNEQMFAAGYLEAYLSAESIFNHYNNMLCQVDCSGYVPPELSAFFDAQDAWMREQIANNKECPYWTYMGSLLAQKEGLMAGYNASSFGSMDDHSLSPWAFTFLNSLGDLLDILPALSNDGSFRRPNFDKMTYHEAHVYLRSNGRCSALLKMTDDMSDVFFGHSTWFMYSSMVRIYKTYSLPLSNPASVMTTMSFSSYPATLSSSDDFYLMKETQLSMLQTTNNIFNASLWDLVKPQSLLAWQRVRAANQMASDGPAWHNIVAAHNSGTYNNQYMIFDGKKFAPGNALQDNALYIVEQIPGYVAGGDATDVLEKGYWSSYNVPYHQDIYVKSGYGSVDAKADHALFTEYQMADRAQLFRRDVGKVSSLDDMEYIMRQNDFQTDPIAAGDPWGAICARGDLEPSSPSGSGGTDSKISSWSALKKGTLEAYIINGPTSQGQKPFAWSTSGLSASYSHMGQPDLFDFEFETVYAFEE